MSFQIEVRPVRILVSLFFLAASMCFVAGLYFHNSCIMNQFGIISDCGALFILYLEEKF